MVLMGCAKKSQPRVELIQQDSVYTMSYGPLTATVDAGYGGRLTRFAYGHHQILTGREIDTLNFGSTFFPSPQSTWGWPPSAPLDRQPYTVLEADSLLHIISGKDEALGIKIGKKFSIDRADTSLRISYYIKNVTDTTVKFAPWEVSRLPVGGTVVYPGGEAYAAHKSFAPIKFESRGELKVYRDTNQMPGEHRLHIADGSGGWMAFLKDGYAFVKQFPDIEPEDFAPGEGEILLYLSPANPYVEMEVQGRYRGIAPADSLVWQVGWKLRPISLIGKPEQLETFIKKEY